MDAIAPQNPPIPTTEATALCGNMSLTIVKRLHDHHWCAAAATLTMATASHILGAIGASIVGTIATAASSSAVFLPRLTLQPRLISALDVQPPPTEPTSAIT